MEMELELNLIDLIDADTLSTIEQAFCDMTEMAAGISDQHGTPITAHCNTSAFCRLIKSSKTGRIRCERCDRQGAALAMENRAAVFYRCHAGLIDFAAPITIQDRILGSFVGGQVIVGEPPDGETAVQQAQELDLDPQAYLDAMRQIPVVTEEQINDAAEFLYALSNILSSIGNSRYKILQSNLELEHATQSKSDFLANYRHVRNGNARTDPSGCKRIYQPDQGVRPDIINHYQRYPGLFQNRIRHDQYSCNRIFSNISG